MINAGRELDGLVAVNVMGLELVIAPAFKAVDDNGNEIEVPALYGVRGGVLPAYSKDIAAAWQVVERMTATHRVSVRHYPHVNNWWQCVLDIRDNKLRFPIERSHDGDEYANAPTAPHAICLAALKAVGAIE